MNKNIKGRILSVLSAAALAVTAMASLPDLSIKANALSGQNAKGIVSQMKIGWNLGNTLDAFDSNSGAAATPELDATQWGVPAPNAQQFQAVKDAGFNTVRIPVTWYEHLEQRGNSYHVNDQWMAYVKKTVDYAIDRDMFVILNIHHENFINVPQFNENTYNDAANKMTCIWSEIAETFKDYDQHLIFEGMNEPRQTGNSAVSEWGDGSGDGGYTWNYVNRLNEVFVRTVRSQGSSQNSERLLMLPGYCASSSYDAIKNIAIPSNAGNVALSVHAYAPYNFTMANNQWANHTFTQSFENDLNSMFNYFDSLQQQKGAPIIIGEFSSSDFNNTEERVKWAKSYISKAKDKGIPCVLWDNNIIGNTDGEAHGYLNRSNCTWYSVSKPVIDAMMETLNISSETGGDVNAEYVWNHVTIGSDWLQIFKSNNGLKLEAWEPSLVYGWKDYVNENYDLVLVYDSPSEPKLVVQDADATVWEYASSSDTSGTPFIRTFTYSDIAAAVSKTGMTLDKLPNLFISATTSEMTGYGLYAVPKNGSYTPPTPEENKYPVTTASVSGNTVTLSWNAIQGADKYAVAYYSAGKWRIYKQFDANTTNFTINGAPRGTFKLIVGARINGDWDKSNINSRYVTVTVS